MSLKSAAPKSFYYYNLILELFFACYIKENNILPCKCSDLFLYETGVLK